MDAGSDVLIMFGTPGLFVASLICGSIGLGVFLYHGTTALLLRAAGQ